MSRLFWNLWLSAIAAFVVVLVVHELILVLVLYSDEELASLERELGRGMNLAAADLARTDPQQWEEELRRLEAQLDFDCEVISADEISPSLIERMADGTAALEVVDIRSANMLTPIPGSDQYLRGGPFHDPPARFTVRHAAMLILAGFAFSLIFWWRIRPLRKQHKELEKVALALSSGERDQRVDLSKLREIDDLGRAFNFMADKTQARADAQQRLLRSVSHELRTPISRMRIATHLLRDLDDRDERNQRVDALEYDFDQLDDLVEELLTYARFEGDAAPLDFVDVDVIELLEELRAEFSDVAIEIDSPTHPPQAKLAPKFFLRAISNLIRNSINAGAKRVQLVVQDHPLRLEVHDDGPGIPKESREMVWEPFHRLQTQNPIDHGYGGHGLGLAIVQQIVRWHDGEVSIHESKPLGGCCVRTQWRTSAIE